MNGIIGFLGFLLLIVSAVFIDVPIIAILAIPVFLTGLILILIFYLKEIDKERIINIFPQVLIIIGVISFCVISGYAAIKYNQFQGYLNMGEEINWNWINILMVAGINILSSFFIFLGIWIGNKCKYDVALEYITPTLIAIPIILLLIKLCVISGIWLGAS